VSAVRIGPLDAALRYLGVPTLLAALTWWATDMGYLFAHTLAEVFSIVVAMTALVVASTSVSFTRNHFVVLVSVALGWCAGLDLLHTMVFKGMMLLHSDSGNLAAQFWLAARLMQAVALVIAPFLLSRSVRMPLLHAAFGTWSVSCTLLIFGGLFPVAYVDGQGLTPFKIYSEYLIIALLMTALWLFGRQRALMSRRLFWSMNAAVLAMIASEFAFTQYVSLHGSANLIGHLLKIYAYWFVYVALVQNTLREPFGMLARAASTYDAIPDPTLIVSADGTIRQANRAAAQRLNLPAAHLVGQSSHVLFHTPGVSADQCPVCQKLSQPGSGFLLALDLSAQQAVEIHVAPFSEGADDEQAWVQVVRNTSEQRRLAREREALLIDLGERIKELRCMYAVSEAVDQTGRPMCQLMDEVVALLPPGFVLPQHLHVGIDSDWGRHGQALPHPAPRHLLSANIQHDAEVVGAIHVWYPDGVGDPRTEFLKEERSLLASVARHVSDAIKRQRSAERIQRLSYLYSMLSETNRAVARCKSREEMLTALLEALRSHSTFSMLFIAQQVGNQGLRLTRHHGITEEAADHLHVVLNHPESPFQLRRADLTQGHVVFDRIPSPQAQPAAFPEDHFQAWLRFLTDAGIQLRTIMPLMCDGQLAAVVGLYSRESTDMDTEQLRLLDDMASDVSFALDRFAADQRRVTAEDTAQVMEHRFREVFENSPIPMQIYSLGDRRVLAINQAHKKWLGYELEEIADVATWFDLIHPADGALVTELRGHWLQSIELAKQGQAAQSPEITLRSKDGSLRTAKGSVTVVNNDAIVAWIDLTDSHRHEQALRDSEQRFRSMVEQTISGIFVRRERQFIYVNPRFAEIMGYTPAELVGQDALRFVVLDEEVNSEAHLLERQIQVDDGTLPSDSTSVPVRRKDGRVIELGLHAKRIVWDDGLPATIVMAQDITDRKRAEEQIATYVKQLEGSMRGTLQAVSNMVEMRDPYTAGHERRVGLIASAIAKEMGWDEPRCENLELMGLVHDIGKIAVPSEILTKPTRLSKVEMELMKGHAQAGYDILKDVPFPAPVAEIIRQHHERMDGSGYPQGLMGDQILPEARILAVADVLESMSSHRPYRPAVGMEAALAEVENNKGRLYDAEVVDAAVKLITERGYVLPS